MTVPRIRVTLDDETAGVSEVTNTAHREDAERAERNAKATERRATNRRAAERRRERAFLAMLARGDFDSEASKK